MTIPRPGSIVVGIDGSNGSLAALRWALRESVSTGSPVEALHCYLPQTLTDLAFSTRQELLTASEIMLDNEVTAALRELPDASVDVQRSSVTGDPGRVLGNRSASAAMLVLGAHGRTAVRDLIFGQVVKVCLRNSRSTVVVVAPDQSAERHEPAPSMETATS